MRMARRKPGTRRFGFPSALSVPGTCTWTSRASIATRADGCKGASSPTRAASLPLSGSPKRRCERDEHRQTNDGGAVVACCVLLPPRSLWLKFGCCASSVLYAHLMKSCTLPVSLLRAKGVRQLSRASAVPNHDVTTLTRCLTGIPPSLGQLVLVRCVHVRVEVGVGWCSSDFSDRNVAMRVLA